MLSVIIPILAIIVLVAIDQVLKAIVVSNMSLYQSVTAIDGLLDWTYTTNTGGGFSILTGQTGLLLVVTAALMILMVVLYARGYIQHWLGKLSFVLIVSGGIGNMIDRIFNDGAVVDFIDVSPIFDFPIFNFADCCVTVGGVLFCVYVLFLHKFKDNKPASDEDE